MSSLNQRQHEVRLIGLPGGSQTVSHTEVAEKLGEPYFGFVHELAILSAIVYRDTPDWESSMLPHLTGWEQIDLPSFHDKLTTPFWQYRVRTLKYEAWKKPKSDGSGVFVALVFRGSALRWDWYTNFRWITRLLPFTRDHYHQTQAVIDDIVVESRQKASSENVEIISVGHSLGGGLAQFAAYSTPHIKKSFAFDSSPVTGFFDVPSAKRKQHRVDTHVYRIYEHGEALAYIRLFMRLIFPLSKKDPRIVQVRYNLVSKGNSVEQHGIKPFAEKLKELHQ